MGFLIDNLSSTKSDIQLFGSKSHDLGRKLNEEREKVQKVPIFIESWCTPFDVLKNWSGAFLENLVYG